MRLCVLLCGFVHLGVLVPMLALSIANSRRQLVIAVSASLHRLPAPTAAAHLLSIPRRRHFILRALLPPLSQAFGQRLRCRPVVEVVRPDDSRLPVRHRRDRTAGWRMPCQPAHLSLVPARKINDVCTSLVPAPQPPDECPDRDPVDVQDIARAAPSVRCPFAPGRRRGIRGAGSRERLGAGLVRAPAGWSLSPRSRGIRFLPESHSL